MFRLATDMSTPIARRFCLPGHGFTLLELPVVIVIKGFRSYGHDARPGGAGEDADIGTW